MRKGMPEDFAIDCRLPEGIQPDICAFGGLADGFAPFPLPDGSTAELAMASIVMKAVQAHHPGVSPTSFACAGKLGDDTNRAKAQVTSSLYSVHKRHSFFISAGNGMGAHDASDSKAEQAYGRVSSS